MSPGHIYHYFSAKEDIIAAIAATDRETTIDFVASLEDQRDFVEAIIAASDESTDSGRIGIDESLAFDIYAEASRNEGIRQIVRTNQKAVRDRLTVVIERAQKDGSVDPALNAKGTAMAISALFEGLMVLGVCNDLFDSTALGRVLPIMLERFLRPPGKAPLTPHRATRPRLTRNVKRYRT
jgi:AcrR family transcriptional regulator